MAFDMFLKIDGIAGDSQHKDHPDEIEVDSFSWGETQTGTFGGGGGGGTGKVVMQDFHFVSRMSKASPQLFLSCAEGSHIKQAVLTVRKSGAESAVFVKIEFEDLLVSEYSTGGAREGDQTTDAFAFNFNRIRVAVDGQQAGWDKAANRKL